MAHGADGDKTITEWVKGTDTRYDFAPAGSTSPQGTMIIDGVGEDAHGHHAVAEGRT